MEELKPRSEILELVKEAAQSQGIGEFTITDVKTNQKGEGYMGRIYLVQGKEAETLRTFDVVIKAAFQDEQLRFNLPIRMCFKNEIHFYTHVLPSLQKLIQDHQIKNLPDFSPTCFKVCLDDTLESLALENLRVSGFEIFNKKDVMDKEHITKIFQIYGQFHACSFALRDQKPGEFNKVVENLNDIFGEFLKTPSFCEHLMSHPKELEKSVLEGQEDKLKKQFEKYMGQSVLRICREVTSWDCDHAVILHGDCWSNNMMFKYQEINGHKKLIDMRFIDFQVTKLGSPVCDLAYCLYSGASKEVFDNLDHYLQIYHKSLTSFLKELGCDSELFPFATLKEHWRKYAKFGLLMAMTLIKIKMINSEDVVDFSEGLEFDEMAGLMANMKYDVKEYERRIREIVEHLYHIDAL